MLKSCWPFFPKIFTFSSKYRSSVHSILMPLTFHIALSAPCHPSDFFTVLGESWNHHRKCGSEANVVMYQCYEGQTARPDIDRKRRLSAQDYVCALQTQHLIVINRTLLQISDKVINIFWTVSNFKSSRNTQKWCVHSTSHNVKRWYFRKCSNSENSLFFGGGGGRGGGLTMKMAELIRRNLL